MMAAKFAALFLSIAALCTFTAWRLQSSAADALVSARRIQNLEVPDSGVQPASVQEYRAIVRSLQRSIDIRTEIDGLLAEVDEIVRALNETQTDAIVTADETRDELARIGQILGGSGRASRESVDGLTSLRDRLERSAELGELIADELEELDESLGPSAVLP